MTVFWKTRSSLIILLRCTLSPEIGVSRRPAQESFVKRVNLPEKCSRKGKLGFGSSINAHDANGRPALAARIGELVITALAPPGVGRAKQLGYLQVREQAN
jgi:hypothetical protein